jgi:hypothetical protein
MPNDGNTRKPGSDSAGGPVAATAFSPCLSYPVEYLGRTEATVAAADP